MVKNLKLHDLGFEKWFEARPPEFLREDGDIARVSAVDRGAYLIRSESGEVPAELAGKLSYMIESPVDLPCVGDWVAVQYYDNDTLAVIHGVFPRKTFLRRKSAGATVDFQMIAANIDAAFIVQSCHFDFNPNRLDRYLVMAADGGVEPIVLLTKTDLISQDDLKQKVEIVKSAHKARIFTVSSFTGSGFDAFRQTLRPKKTYCLLGSSGVGKTTIINRLMGREAFNTPYSVFQLQINHGDDTILDVQKYLEKNFHKPASNASMAAKFGMSLRAFERRFKKATGDTPRVYLRRVRVDAAKRLLETSNLSFADITFRVGYEDVSSFRRVFIKKVGPRPGEYKNKFQYAPSFPST